MRRLVLVLATTVLLVTACALPQQREEETLGKIAATPQEIETVFARYEVVRDTAARLLSPNPLSIIQTEAVLDIETGSFEVAQRLAASDPEQDDPIDVQRTYTPRFGSYPLWFVAVVRDEGREVTRVQVFERAAAADPWLLIATPETVLDADLPELRERDGAVVRVAPDDEAGTGVSAQRAADDYAALLADAESDVATTFAADGFVEQVRAATEQNRALEGVGFEQTWASQEVRHAVRTSDGGILAFVDLSREDTYDAPDDVTVTWPEDSPQRAFVPEGISTTGTLLYRHQVLMLIPVGDEPVRVIGQFGGVVGAEGF